MTVKNIIVLTRPGQKPETWGSLTRLCDSHGLNYTSLARNKFPFDHEGFSFEKVKFNEKTINKN